MPRGSDTTASQLLKRALALVTSFALAVVPLLAQPAHAQSQSKISAALLAEMTAHPLERIPIILEKS